MEQRDSVPKDEGSMTVGQVVEQVSLYLGQIRKISPAAAEKVEWLLRYVITYQPSERLEPVEPPEPEGPTLRGPAAEALLTYGQEREDAGYARARADLDAALSEIKSRTEGQQ